MKNIITLGAAALALAACAPAEAPAEDTPVVEETTVIEESASDAADAAVEAARRSC
jgi:ABC-type glycerol-3-phosphate transport system substrate-binding protein